MIYLSTVHSAKGLERDDIVVIKPDDLPMRWRDILPWQEQQEDNLHYVALTRAKNRLIVVGDCEWYKLPKPKTEPETEDSNDDDVEVCNLNSNEPSDNELAEAVKTAIARFGPKAVIIEAIQQATVSEIQEIMAILDDW